MFPLLLSEPQTATLVLSKVKILSQSVEDLECSFGIFLIAHTQSCQKIVLITAIATILLQKKF